MKRAFVMLAAPSMIGKSTQAVKLAQSNPNIRVIANDDLMYELFRIARLDSPTNIPINQEKAWLNSVDSRADARKLITVLHRDYVSLAGDCPIILAEGYMYMRRWYRNEVLRGLRRLPQITDCWLLKYCPSQELQISRRARVFEQSGRPPVSQASHWRDIETEWARFDAPDKEGLTYETIDDCSAAATLSRVAAALESK
jgi:hypothetical protein